MDALRDLADRLDGAGGDLADLARRLPYVGPGERAFAVDGPGRLGEVGRVLYRHWLTALDNRTRELTGAVDRLADTAAALRTAGRAYADGDETVRSRHAGEA